ncbi:MAG: hypothetical protein QOH90_74 [Actinomycetota bacterium]|jgi:hypothetical protein|nr:hypothetical protein [Actinomycetota bacterium]
MKDAKSRIFLVTILVLAFSAMVLPVANAYIDASSGSYIIQMLVGGLLGVGLAIKVFWHKITGLFTKRDTAPGKEEQPTAPK